jgi:CheY-like chemotaxis protein
MIRQSEFDVALVDIGLPGKGGLDLLKQIKTERPKLAVLMLSMYARGGLCRTRAESRRIRLPDQEQPPKHAPRGQYAKSPVAASM